MKIIELSKIILKGSSQVMLQNNHITGLLFLAGIFYNSWILGIGAIIGLIAGTLTAFILKYDENDIRAGFYGANGALVGIALPFFFDFSPLLLVFLGLGASMSSVVMNFMHRRNLFPYTFPFIISTWVSMFLIKSLGFIPEQPHISTAISSVDVLSALAMGFGQVMFQANIITGIVFLIAILISSRLAAIYAFAGSAIGLLFSFIFSFHPALANAGIFGFNAVLCGIAFAGKDRFSAHYAVISIILSVLIIQGMLLSGFAALTAPFVFATWITIGVRSFMKRLRTTSQ